MQLGASSLPPRACGEQGQCALRKPPCGLCCVPRNGAHTIDLCPAFRYAQGEELLW
jgi:hypothetical protein